MNSLLKPHAAPIWLPSGHAQTIWASLAARQRLGACKPLQRERWTTPDGQDFIDADWQRASCHSRPLCVMFHGLEGSSASHYAQASADWAQRNDINWVMPHFRGCSGTPNLAPRAYHAGDHEEIDWILKRLRQQHRAHGGTHMVVIGVSLGGNALMRWAGEHGQEAVRWADALVTLSATFQLKASAQAISRGVGRQLYTRMFLRSMKPKAQAKWRQHPQAFALHRAMAADDLQSFDDAFTAPLHGFSGVHDYWERASAMPFLPRVQVPSLLINALNDPFVPAHSLPQLADVSEAVQLWQPRTGGHVGFVTGAWPGQVCTLADACGAWLLDAAGAAKPSNGESAHG